ncbi:MAG TPA: hypothetical protein PKK40_05670 [Marmoricola sp.]|nr:hypothetical protein [Marmoricola sp.]
MGDCPTLPAEVQQFLGFMVLGVKPKAAYGVDGPATSKAGVLKWTVDVVSESGDTLGVTLTSA